MFGSVGFSDHPIASGPPPYLFVQSDFEDLLELPDLIRDFILEGEGWDPVAGVVVPIRFGAGQRIGPGVFHMGLLDAVNFQTQLFAGSSGVGGASVPTLGDIGIGIGDADSDAIIDPTVESRAVAVKRLTRLSVNGRTFTVKMGRRGFSHGQYQPVFVGTAEDATWNLLRYSITLRDPSAVLAKPVQPVLYAGTGGATGTEGASDLKGVPKPIAMGRVFNAAPVVVNQAELVLQYHDGSMEAIDEQRDIGVVLTNAGDISTLLLADVFAWTQVGGEYVTDLAHGLVRLGALPQGQVTADIRGDNTGGYVDTIGEIARRILTQRAGLSTGALDLAAFAQLATDQPAEAGIYIAGGAREVPTVLDELLEGILGFRTFTRTGLITIGRVAFSSPVATIEAKDVISIERVRTELPCWRRRIGYARSYTVQGPDDLATVDVADATRSFAAQEYRITDDPTGEDDSILIAHPMAKDVTVNSCLALQADAETEAARQLALFGTQNHVYSLAVKDHQFRRQSGQTLTLIYPRFGLDAGEDFILLGLDENTSTGKTGQSLWR